LPIDAVTIKSSMLDMISRIITSETGLYSTKTSLYQMNDSAQKTMAKKALRYTDISFFVIEVMK
jgi:hypothetical protein